MDTTRWKSILVPREMYEEVRDSAKMEGRTISGQLCYAYEQYRAVEAKKRARVQKKIEQVASKDLPRMR